MHSGNGLAEHGWWSGWSGCWQVLDWTDWGLRLLICRANTRTHWDWPIHAIVGRNLLKYAKSHFKERLFVRACQRDHVQAHSA